MKRFPRRRALVLAGLVVLAAACTPDRGQRKYPGALTKSIDDYTGAEFIAFVKKLDYVGGHEKDRDCKGDTACAKGKKVLVKVDAVATQDSISAGTSPQFGAVYVHAVNKGDATEQRYSMQPARSGFDYYFIVSADSSGKAMRWRLEEVDAKAGTHKAVGTGPFDGCTGHTWQPGASANFYSCDKAKAAHDSVVKLGLALQLDSDPVWAACGAGCCVATGP